jgi:hypothetical protein
MHKQQADPIVGKAVLKFFSWSYNNGEKMATDLDYVHLPKEVVAKVKVEWNKFKAEWDHKTYNGYVLQFQEIDCDVDETTASKYNVTKYPTIKLVKDDTVIDFDAKPTVDTLTRFLIAGFDP